MVKDTRSIETLARVEQKLDDLAESLKAHIQREDPIVSSVPKLAESIKWVSRAVVGAYALAGSLAAGAIASIWLR